MTESKPTMSKMTLAFTVFSYLVALVFIVCAYNENRHARTTIERAEQLMERHALLEEAKASMVAKPDRMLLRADDARSVDGAAVAARKDEPEKDEPLSDEGAALVALLNGPLNEKSGEGIPSRTALVTNKEGRSVNVLLRLAYEMRDDDRKLTVAAGATNALDKRGALVVTVINKEGRYIDVGEALTSADVRAVHAAALARLEKIQRATDERNKQEAAAELKRTVRPAHGH